MLLQILLKLTHIWVFVSDLSCFVFFKTFYLVCQNTPRFLCFMGFSFALFLVKDHFFFPWHQYFVTDYPTYFCQTPFWFIRSPHHHLQPLLWHFQPDKQMFCFQTPLQFISYFNLFWKIELIKVIWKKITICKKKATAYFNQTNHLYSVTLLNCFSIVTIFNIYL